MLHPDRTRTSRLSTVTCFSVLLVLAAPAMAEDPAPPPSLFRPIDAADERLADFPSEDGPTVARWRFVELRGDVLTDRILDPTADVPDSAAVRLDLFDDLQVDLQKDAVERLDGGKVAWTGHAEGDESDTAVFIISRAPDGSNTLTGNLVVEGTLFQVRTAGGRIHAIREIDQERFPEELPPSAPELPSLEEAPPTDPGLDVPEDGPAEIEVLVLYTKAAKAAVTDIETEILLAVTETNQSYEASGILQRIRLVGSEEIDYTESGDLEKDRNRLQKAGDGQLDAAHPLRESHKADLVNLWVNSGAFCGIAYIMEQVRPDFAAYGFSVVRRDCATGYYSFGHELGHNMGARHDRVADPTDGSPFPFNHGFFRPQPTDKDCLPWRTVMGYDRGCSKAGTSCRRQKIWSNPERKYCGDPTGIAGAESTAADNHRTLNLTAATVASFR
jgi:peptidyl-Asp metalloendopeptidase